MKIDTQSLKNSFSVGYEIFRECRLEAELVQDYYHNRQYTEEELAILEERGQPKETFNIIKLFARMLIGYYSNVTNTVVVNPVQKEDIPLASLLSDVVKYVMRDNNMQSEGDKIKLDGLLTGLMVAYIDVEETGRYDQFGRPIRRITIEHVPSNEVILDPMSRKEDYSDARFIHRFKWLSKEQIKSMFGAKKLNELVAYFNFLEENDTEFTYNYKEEFTGKFKRLDNYLVVQSIVIDDNGDRWNIYWSDNVILRKEKITYKEVLFPYRVHKLHVSNKAEYYGIFREILETQKAINQALIKIQLMVNTQKAFVEEGAVDDIDEFAKNFNRVNAIIPIKSLQGIRIENLNAEVAQQYNIINAALDRIQRILGINDSFLGMAYASDSGAKVKLQQNASIMSLRYITNRIEEFYRLLGWDIVNLVKQYYTANQVLRITDELTGEKWIEINKPEMRFTGEYDENGNPIFEPVLEPAIDPASGKPMYDKWGNLILIPVPTGDTDIAFSNVDIEIKSVAYNDEEDKNRLMLEQVLQGAMGQILAQVNPAGYFKVAGLSIQTLKTKYSLEIAEIFNQTAAMLGAQQQQQIAQQGGVENGNEAQLMKEGNITGGDKANTSSTIGVKQ